MGQLAGKDLWQLLESEYRKWRLLKGVLSRANLQLGVYLLRHSRREVRAGSIIDGNHHHAPKNTSEKYRNPFRRILSPEQDAIAFADRPPVQLPREPTCEVENLGISPADAPIIAANDVGALGAMPLKIAQIVY
jgi:hypothetical protein